MINYKGLTALAEEIHENAAAHGWWDEERKLPEILMLCVSELSEALEIYRDGHNITEITHECNATEADKAAHCINDCENCAYAKPEGIPVELADTIIRVLDYCGHEGIDIETVVRMKHEYNKTRPYRHGSKRC